MVRRLSRWLALATCLVVISVSTSMQPGPVAAQETSGTTAQITAPVEGQQLFGLVNITGSAGHPTAFDSYTLEYNDLADPNAPWLLAQERVRQQVSNDVLGNWNTNMVPDGVYRLRLRVFLQDGQVGGEFVVSGLRVVNSAPTPVPTAASGGVTQQNTPTPGPSPTSLIQQPPSNSPATPSVITGLDSASNGSTGVSSTTTSSSSTTRINTGRIREAFCSGAYLAVGIFVVMLAYSLLRGHLRPYTRRLFWQIQDELENDR